MESLSILLLEDDETLRELLEGTLTGRGYRVVAVGRGDDAIERGRQGQFDLIIADVRMEGTDGLTALGQVKREQPDIRSIVITGYSTEADSIRAIRLGVSDYLKKPFRVGEFMEAVERQAERCRLARVVSQRELDLLKTAVWGLEQALEAHGSAREAGRLAEIVSLALGMAAGPAMETRLLTLARALGKPAPGQPSDLQQRIASSCQARADGVEEEADAEILAALEQAALPEPSGNGVSVLSVARALERSQSVESARGAYQGLLEGGSAREQVEALLGLARLGDPEQARKAVELARQVGPLATARSALEAALLLGGAEAGDLAGEAAGLAGRLGLRSQSALAEIVQARWSGQDPPEGALAILLEPEQLPARADLARWGLDWILTRPGSEALLACLAREAPREFNTVLLRGQLSVPARQAAARALAGSWGLWAEESLRLLAEDPDPKVRQEAQPRGGAAGPPMLRLFSLGPFEVFHGDERVEDRQWKSPKVRLMLAFLAAQQGRPISEDLLTEVFWPEEPRGKRNLSATLSHLRSNLRPSGWPGELNYVVRASQGISLNPELPRWHDYDELERAAAGAARAGEGPEAARLCRQVVDLYRGPYLEGQYADWVLLRRTRVERLVLTALETLLNREADAASALELAERTMELDSYHQEACLRLLNAHLALRRPEEAVRRFETFRKVLQRDLGLEPSIELLRAYETARLSL